ncbi:two-component system regulatory protein YycI [Salicibibacter cibarius]|uniref:Two-component system regulatory protein YycI n=1 Tax=Salicibibacter cibarius TaxID=2743000 RepID=A0A7T7CDJ9_9BACI|nr:two-component system regulatory protein YycI [Salicibibacter cibarius]QQK78078.1 two-component system regulatory protein YycI [Salicibibacter cibarius]
MDWNKTKTIFIFTFILLNGFLIAQLFNHMENRERDVEVEDNLEAQLDHQNIDIETELPNEEVALSVVRSRTMESLPEEAENSYDDADVISDVEFDSETGELSVWLEEPYEIDEEDAWQERREFIDTHVYDGDAYRFASRDETQTDYYSNHEDRTLIAPRNTHLTIYENEEGAIDSFIQQFVHTENMAEQSISPALDAIDTLIQENALTTNSTVTNVDYVYYSALSEEYVSNEVMYAPYYRIVVQEEFENEDQRPDVYLVSAVEGEETIREP